MSKKSPGEAYDEHDRAAVYPPYISFAQQNEYTCVPACVQMILYRRGIPLLSQGKISKLLKTGMPKKEARRFPESIRAVRSRKKYGTSFKTLNPFFRTQNIDLRAIPVDPDDIRGVRRFVRENILVGNDLIASYHMALLGDSLKDEYHAVLIQEIDENRVICVDPYIEHEELWDVSVPDFLFASSFGGEFCVIHSHIRESREAVQAILRASKK